MLARTGKYPIAEDIVARATQQQPKKNLQLPKNLQSNPSSQDGNIKQLFGANRVATQPKSTAVIPPSTKPLVPKSANAVPRPPSTGPRFGGICGSSNSFDDEVHGMGWNRENHPSLEKDLEWLGDQSDLEFDGGPVSLPAPPKAQPTQQAGVQQLSQFSAMSWSSSPLSHFQPRAQQVPPPQPPPAQGSSPTQSSASSTTKRKREYDIQPTRKRKNLPWKKQEVKEVESIDLTQVDEDQPPISRNAKTPAAKKYLPHEATESALKEKRRHHKLQHKQQPTATQDMFCPDPDSLAAQPKASNRSSINEINGVKSNDLKKKRFAQVFLSSEQRHILDLVKQGRSVFFTGPAGTGKSVLMREIIAELKRKHARKADAVAVTASTGLAACNIGGMTLHSFSGIGLGKETAQELCQKIRKNRKAKDRWMNTRALVIDEVSMIDGDLFDKLNHIGRTIRKDGRPWGGLQLILTGDFFQLPPVPDDKIRGAKFAFDAATWNTSIDHTIGLTQVFRQKDADFATMLNEMRVGKVTDQTLRTFQSLSRPLQFDDGIEVTELFSTRLEVETANNTRLRALKGELLRFTAKDSGEPSVRERLLQYMMAPKTIELKVGAQVMLIKNFDQTLVNGSIGTIKSFKTVREWTLSAEAGDEALELDSGDESYLKKKIRKFASTHVEADPPKFPVVEFLAADGTHRTRHVVAEEWKVELPNGEVQAQRSQLPLILAWALSIHKAQGQTLDRVKVNLGRTFEKGQAYVALSRATTKEGLQVLKFDKTKIMAHPRVVHFYEKLYSAEDAAKNSSKKQPTIQAMFNMDGAGGPYGNSYGESEKEPAYLRS